MTPKATIATLISADALAAGQTLRALAHEGRPNAETAAVLGRVGEWLVNASTIATEALGQPASLTARASDLVTHALVDAGSVRSEAIAALVGALGHMALSGTLPRQLFTIMIESLTTMRDHSGHLAVSA